MAIELAADHIRVNAVAPGGGVTGERRDRWFQQAAAQLGGTAQEHRQRMLDAILTHQLVEPDDIARLCVFLASDDSRQITGEVLNINGGHGLAVLDATLPQAVLTESAPVKKLATRSRQIIARRALALTHSLAITEHKMAIKMSVTCGQARTFNDACSCSPMPPAPTRPSTVDSRMLMSQRNTDIPAKAAMICGTMP